MRKNVSIFKYALLAVTVLAANIYANTINKEFNVADVGLLKIATDIGSIDIDSHDKNTVLIEVNINGKDEDKMDISFKNKGDDVTIIGEFERNGFSFFNDHNRLKVKYTITVPQDYNIDLNTSGGGISIEDLNGDINAHTSGGSISLTHVNGEIDINTSGGSINADDVKGIISAHTSGGSINAKLYKTPTADSKFSTSGGSINAYLAKNIAVDIYAKTSGGRVRSEFNVNGTVKKNSVVGEINGGGPELSFTTGGGSVRLNEL